MYDIYGSNYETFVKSMKVISTELATITQILIDKNIVSEEEYMQYRNTLGKVTEDTFDTEFKKQEDKFRQENPLLSKLFGLD